MSKLLTLTLVMITFLVSGCGGSSGGKKQPDPQNYSIAATASPADGGTISGTGSFDQGSSVTLTATANTGYTFVNWTEGGVEVSASSSYTFAATSDRSLVANFNLNSYAIDATANPVEGGTVDGTGDYDHGVVVTLQATVNAGYTFVNWTEGGAEVSVSNSYTFTATSDRSLVANFSLNNYAIDATANPVAGGTVNGAGDYDHGLDVTLEVTANIGYTFVNWTEGGAEVSVSNSFTFTATSDRSLVANFSLDNAEALVFFQDSTDEFFEYRTDTGVSILLSTSTGTSNDRLRQMDIRPTDGVVYAASSTDNNNNNLYTVTVDTGDLQLVGQPTPIGLFSIYTALAFHPSDGNLYGIVAAFLADGTILRYLGRIDQTDASFTVIGELPFSGYGTNPMEFDNDGNLYVLQSFGGLTTLYSVNLGDASGTVIASTDSLYGPQDLAFTPRGTFYLTDFLYGLYELDVTTGAVTLVSPLNVGHQFGGLYALPIIGGEP